MSAHSRLSPSSRHRWGACPASVAACEKYPDEDTSSPAAIDGTHSHTLLEYCIKHGVEPINTVNETFTDHEGSFCVDRDRAARVTVAVDYVRGRVAEFGGSATVVAEAQVDPSPLIGRNDLAGTVDVHIVAPDTLEIIDYKDGINAVDAENNPQMEQYLFGILASHVRPDGTFPFNKYRLTIIQPKVTLTGGNPISTYEFGTEELSEKFVKLVSEAIATDAADAPFVPGEKQCRYCAHAGACSARVNDALQKSGIGFGNVEKQLAVQAAQSESDTMTDDRLRELVEAAPTLRRMIEDAEKEAMRRIESGHPIPGLKLVRGRGSRSWNGKPEEIETRLKRMGVPKGEIWQTSLISIAQLEKLRWQKRDGTEKQLSPKQLELIHNEMVSTSEGKLTVVPEADKRPAVGFGNIGQMFGPTGAAVEPTPEPALPSWLS